MSSSRSTPPSGRLCSRFCAPWREWFLRCRSMGKGLRHRYRGESPEVLLWLTGRVLRSGGLYRSRSWDESAIEGARTPRGGSEPTCRRSSVNGGWVSTRRSSSRSMSSAMGLIASATSRLAMSASTAPCVRFTSTLTMSSWTTAVGRGGRSFARPCIPSRESLGSSCLRRCAPWPKNRCAVREDGWSATTLKSSTPMPHLVAYRMTSR